MTVEVENQHLVGNYDVAHLVGTETLRLMVASTLRNKYDINYI